MLHGGTAFARRRVLRPPREEQTPAVETPRGAREEAVNRVEAVLLLSREPVNSRKLAELASLEDGTHARTTVKRLNKHLDATGRAFRVEETGGGYIMLTRPKFAPWLRRLEHCPPEVKLSAPAMETLTVIAYRQPVLRADIEAIRGVACGEILRQLMERDFVRIGGRSEELGRPYLYATTKRFLRTFGLRNLNDLPRADTLRGKAGDHAAPAQAVETVVQPLENEAEPTSDDEDADDLEITDDQVEMDELDSSEYEEDFADTGSEEE